MTNMSVYAAWEGKPKYEIHTTAATKFYFNGKGEIIVKFEDTQF